MAARAFDRITIKPGKMNGQPCIRGLRLTVRSVLEAIGQYASRDELRGDYPELEDEDIRQATAYAAAILGGESVEIETPSGRSAGRRATSSGRARRGAGASARRSR